ncbi:MAG: hypothetical protein A4E19_14050 [Nitrospira sp. SG-bin1]|nr:MAG: hypothetical protein A4E19_14050 [Nitrospira sp. SG-bin1]
MGNETAWLSTEIQSYKSKSTKDPSSGMLGRVYNGTLVLVRLRIDGRLLPIIFTNAVTFLLAGTT